MKMKLFTSRLIRMQNLKRHESELMACIGHMWYSSVACHRWPPEQCNSSSVRTGGATLVDYLDAINDVQNSQSLDRECGISPFLSERP